MARKLSEFETQLEPMFQNSLAALLKNDSLCNDVVDSFAAAVIAPATLPKRLTASPFSAVVLGVTLLRSEPGLWNSIESRLFGGQSVSRPIRHAVYDAYREIANQLGLSEHESITQLVNQCGIDQLKIRAHSEPGSFFATIQWFGPVPERLDLVFANESWPWAPPIVISLDQATLTAASDEVVLNFPAPPAPGRYEVYGFIPAMANAAESRDGKVKTTLFAVGLETDIEEHLREVGQEHVDLFKVFERAREVRKDTGRALRRLLANHAREYGAGLISQIFAITQFAPVDSLNNRTFHAICETFRMPDLQQGLINHLQENPGDIGMYERHALPGSSLTIDEPLDSKFCGLWETPHFSTLFALVSDLPQEELTNFGGDLVGKWSEAEPGETKRLSIVVEGRQYRIVVDSRLENGDIRAILPTVNEEDVEVLLQPTGDRVYNLFPEIRSRSLLLSGDALVTNVLESPLYKKKKVRAAIPVNKMKPVEAKVLGERKRPKVQELTASMGDARRLALKASQRAVNEIDQEIIAGLFSSQSKALDAANYGKAMLEWAIPLPVADQSWKQHLWAIDRETKALLGSGAAHIAEGLEKVPAKARQLLEALKREMLNAKSTPAPLALEKAVFQFAILARCMARVPYDAKADDVYEAFCKVETRMQLICPTLLGYACTLVELVLRDGGLG